MYYKTGILLLLLSVTLAYELKSSTVIPIDDQPKGFLKADNEEIEDHFLSFGTICRNKFFPFEQHKVRTYDGYFLTIFRIPGKKFETLSQAIAAKRPALLLWHDFLDSADTWVINDEDKAPAFVLASKGYDVWIANSRGNKYSREHRYLDPDRELDEEEFFGYTFEDMAKQDTNATVSYIRTETKKTSIGVIGHGLGATQFLLAPQTGISTLVSLSPISILNHTEERLITLLAEDDYYIQKLKEYKINEIFPSNYLKEGIFATV